MGDWSDNLEYEQREYYGHFYDTFEEECDDVYKEGTCETCDHFEQCLATWRKDEEE